MNPDTIENQVLIFAIEGQRFALPVCVVDRVVRAVAVTPLPGAPRTVLGVINVQGRVTPVMNLRRRMRMAEREIEPADQFILITAEGWSAALVAERVDGLSALPSGASVPAESVVQNSEVIAGILKVGPDLVLLQDARRFLEPKDRRDLDAALSSLERDSDINPAGATP